MSGYESWLFYSCSGMYAGTKPCCFRRARVCTRVSDLAVFATLRYVPGYPPEYVYTLLKTHPRKFRLRVFGLNLYVIVVLAFFSRPVRIKTWSCFCFCFSVTFCTIFFFVPFFFVSASFLLSFLSSLLFFVFHLVVSAVCFSFFVSGGAVLELFLFPC